MRWAKRDEGGNSGMVRALLEGLAMVSLLGSNLSEGRIKLMHA